MEPALAIFGPLLGHCFAAAIGADVIDRHCFASVFGGAHVRDTHVVTAQGKAVYSGETIYSFDGHALDFTYVNSMGGVGHGTATVESETLSFSGSMKPSPGQSAVPMKGRWVISAEGYDVLNEGQKALRFLPAR